MLRIHDYTVQFKHHLYLYIHTNHSLIVNQSVYELLIVLSKFVLFCTAQVPKKKLAGCAAVRKLRNVIVFGK